PTSTKAVPAPYQGFRRRILSRLPAHACASHVELPHFVSKRRRGCGRTGRRGAEAPTPENMFESALDRVADVLDRLAVLTPALAERLLLSLARCLVRLAFVPQPVIVAQVARGLLHATLGLIDLALHFIFVPHESLSSHVSVYVREKEHDACIGRHCTQH